MMALMDEIVASRGEKAFHDKVGQYLTGAMGYLVMAMGEMESNGSPNANDIREMANWYTRMHEESDPEPHGSRDTFVPHPYEGAVCSQCNSRLNVNDDGRCTACGSQHDL